MTMKQAAVALILSFGAAAVLAGWQNAEAQIMGPPRAMAVTTNEQFSEDASERYGGELLSSYDISGAFPIDLATGRITGRLSFGPLTFTKDITQSTPQYARALGENREIEELTVRFFSIDGATRQEVLTRTITLLSVLVVSQQTYLPHTLDPDLQTVAVPTETISVTFRRLTWRDETTGEEATFDATSPI